MLIHSLHSYDCLGGHWGQFFKADCIQARLAFASQVLHLLQTEGLWQPRLEHVCGYHCPTAFAYFAPVSHFRTSHSISHFFIRIVFVMGICDQ